MLNMKIPENIFRAYDIRGIFGKDLTADIAEWIGKGFGTFLGEKKQVVVGRDVRLSGKILENALIPGLTSVGCDVIDIGIVPTPILYFAITHKKKDGGVMVTASVDGDEYTMIEDLSTGERKLVKVGEFIDNIEKGELKKFAVLAFNPATGEVSFQKIKGTFKHKIDEPLYEVKLQCGRKVRITSSHSIFSFRKEKIVPVAAKELEIGDFVPVANTIPLSSNTPKINLAKELWFFRNGLRKIILSGSSIKKIVLKKTRKKRIKRIKLKLSGRKFLLEKRKKLKLSRKEVAKLCGLSCMTIQRIELGTTRKFVKLEFLEKYLKFLHLDPVLFLSEFTEKIGYFKGSWKDGRTFNSIKLNDLTQAEVEGIDTCLLHGYGYPANSIKNPIEISQELLRLIGYYAAEGNLECEDRVCFNLGPAKGHEKRIVNEIVSASEKIFGIKPKVYDYGYKTKVAIDNVIVYGLFAKILNFEGKKSHTKSLPDFVYSLPKEYILELLRSLFLGDGSIIRGKGIKFSSTSEKLAVGICYLLGMLGVHFIICEHKGNRNRKKIHEILVLSKKELKKISKIWLDHYLSSSLNVDYRGKFKTKKSFKDLVFLKVKEIREVKPSSAYVYDFCVESGTFIAGTGICCHNSHNPAEWNGFKMLKERGLMCGQGSGMEQIKQIIVKGDFRKVERTGKIEKYGKILEEYSQFVCDKIELERKLKIVLDTCNGAAGLIAPKLFKRLGCKVITLNEQPDGRFPSHPPEQDEKSLAKLGREVINNKADFGVGFDGDGDRSVFVDDKGRAIPGDISAIVFVKDVLKEKKGRKIVFDVCCSSALEDFIKENDGIPVVNRVGRTFILERVLKENAAFGCEVSSHFYFPQIYGFDDGIFASLKMAEILSKDDLTFSQIIDSIKRYFTSPVKKIKCSDEYKFEVVNRLKSKLSKKFKILDIDGVKAFSEDGWFLIRPSNTEPVIKINAEAKNERKLKKLLSLAVELVRKEIKND